MAYFQYQDKAIFYEEYPFIRGPEICITAKNGKIKKAGASANANVPVCH